MTPEWWQQQHVKQDMAQHDAQHAAAGIRPCGCLADPVVFGHYWCGQP